MGLSFKPGHTDHHDIGNQFEIFDEPSATIMLRFDDRVAIVTGAGAGLGRTYALLFASRGAKVVVNDVSKTAADDVVQEIKAKGGVAVPNYNSVTDGAQVVDTAIQSFGRVDIVVNNAGILRDASFVKMTDKEWNAVLAVHLQGAYAVTHAAWPHMRKQKYGRVVLITSVNGLYGQFGQTNYSANKSAMIGFGKSLAKEGARQNIKVNIVATGAGSAMTATIMPEDMVKRWKPEYVAPTIAYLSHESVEVSGCIFESGGGYVGQVKWQRSPGHFFDISKEITIEDVQAQWSKITDFTNAEDPEQEEISPQIKQIMEAPTPSTLRSPTPSAMIRLKAKQQEKKAEEEAAAAVAANADSNDATKTSDTDAAAEKPKTVKILGVGRGKRGGASKDKRRTPGEIRIQKDIAELDGGQAATVSFPDSNDLTTFNLKISVDTGLWKGASYNFSFKIPAMYPHEPPKVRCLTRIYHPNIDLEGNVCLNILREDWKPVLDINSVIYGLIYLFYEPNPDDPLNREAAEMFRNNYSQFEQMVKRSLRGYPVQGVEFEPLVS
ncbi:TPA: hypothetical protein N0F65_012464 [Lagenidium giganteum]|uniref:UBC core domain-containing protein n=1 Tax=Lagenidium giganteum TaxID=4803 RepID=A0AAV2YJ54_9STRA|nr:TPA: hypothetical protein N0F65_012464 [Lagenidium giganteum]